MTTVAPNTKLLLRPQRVPILVSLTVLFMPIAAAAQTATAPSSSQTEEHQAAGETHDLAPLSDRSDRVRFTNESASHYYNSIPLSPEPASYYFPPVPPPLNAEFPLLGPLARNGSAPPELAGFVDELFYPMLAARLADDDLPKALRTRLQAYRTGKIGLQNELRSKITGLKDADPPERERQLIAFAAAQTPRITVLEETAEKIRTDLRRIDIIGVPTETTEWTGSEAWRQRAGHGAPASAADRQLESEVLRNAAFFQEGLTAAQRRRLREAAVELETEADPAQVNATEGWLLHFSPEPARIRILANLPAPLAKDISEYVSAKKGLKTELREALRDAGASGSKARLEAFRLLAIAQAPRVAALEAGAEEIRRDLAALPNPPGPPAPPLLPPELMTRISAYRTHKLELLKTLYAMLTGSSAQTANPAQNPEGAKAGESIERTLSWMRDSATPTAVQPAGLNMPAKEFNRRQSKLIGELNRELAGIRESLAEYVRAANQPADRKSVNDLLNDFEHARQKQEIWDKYRDYQTAVLSPGLSPEQRRLLFAAAVEQLALPLPAAERAH